MNVITNRIYLFFLIIEKNRGNINNLNFTSQIGGFCSWLVFRTGCWYILNRLAGWLSWSFEALSFGSQPMSQIYKVTSQPAAITFTCGDMHEGGVGTTCNLPSSEIKCFFFYNNNNNNFLKYLIVSLKWVLKMGKLCIWLSIWYMRKFTVTLYYILI